MQGYGGMSFDACVKLTYPQILMLCHAANIRQERLEARTKVRKKNGTATIEDQINDDDDLPMFEGKPIDQLDSDGYARYIAGSF